MATQRLWPGVWMHSAGQRFLWLRPWKTLDPTLQIHRKQKSVQALTILRLVIMVGPTERSLQARVGVWLFLHLPWCGEAQVFFFFFSSFFYRSHSGNRTKSNPWAGSLHSDSPLFQAVFKIINTIILTYAVIVCPVLCMLEQLQEKWYWEHIITWSVQDISSKAWKPARSQGWKENVAYSWYPCPRQRSIFSW